MAENSNTYHFKECIRALNCTYLDLRTCSSYQRIAIMFSFDIENTDETFDSEIIFQYFFRQIDAGKNIEESLSETIELYLK
jgi:hypothetical protein